MAGFCLLAMMVGACAASTLPVVSFAASLSCVLVVGVGIALLSHPLDATLVGGLSLFASAQIGYGLGLAVSAALGVSRRPRDGTATPPVLRDFRVEK